MRRTQETTNSECQILEEYTKFATVAEARAALLDVGSKQYAKVTKPKENLCLFFGPFQSIQSNNLRIVICGGTINNLLEPTKFFRLIVGPPSRKGYIGRNWGQYLQHLKGMGILGNYLFEQIKNSDTSIVGGHDGPDNGPDNKDSELVQDTSFHLRSIFWDNSSIGFTFLIFGNHLFFQHIWFLCT